MLKEVIYVVAVIANAVLLVRFVLLMKRYNARIAVGGHVYVGYLLLNVDVVQWIVLLELGELRL